MSVIAGFISSQALGIAGNLLTAGFAKTKFDVLRPNIKDYLGGNFTVAAKMLGTDILGVHNIIESAIDADSQEILTLTVDGLAAGVGGMFATLYDAWRGSSMLMSSYASAIQSEGITPYIKRWVNHLLTPNIPDVETAWRMYRLGNLPYPDVQELALLSGWKHEWVDQLNYVFQTPLPIGVMLDLYRRGTMTLEDFKWQLNLSRVDEHRIDGIINLAVQIPEPYRIADFAAKELIDNAQAEGAFKWFGMDARWAGIWKESQRAFPQLGVLNELLWRKLISEEDWNYALRRQGYIEKWPEMMHGLLEAIPPSQDLVTMVVREAWEPENVTPAPEIFAKYMAMRGFTKDWSDRYWTAHWLPMPIQYAYDNLRRGYWTKEQFDDLLRIADLHPRWREAIYNVAFQPPSIREMGYGFDVQVYTEDDIVKFRRWGGLSEEDAKKAGRAMVAYRTEAEREAIRRDYLHLYVNGNISREDFETALIAVGTVTEGVPLWLERGDLEIELKSAETSILEPKNITRSDAQWLFENGLRTEEWFRETLKNLGYLEASIDAYTDQSKKRIADKIKPVVPTEPRKLTLAMIQNLIKLELLDKNEATAEIVKLGYTNEDAALIIQIMLTRVYAEPEERMLTDAHVTALYDYNLVSESDILAHFKALNYSDTDARLLTQLAVITKNLPDLKDMYGKGWINQNQLFAGVKALGIPMEFVEPSEFPKLSKLIEVIGLPEEKAKRLMMTIVKAEQPARTQAEKDLTKAEIVKGVKVGVVTPQEGVSLLQGLGYDENEAWYILAINKVISAGDPEGYWDMRRVVETAKKARGEASVQIPDELVVLEKQRKSILAQLNTLKASKATEEEIGKVAVELAGVEARMHTIIAKLKLA
jgi:hypothetical protein